MDDVIYRQAAIDALEREKVHCTAFRDGYAPKDVFEKYNAGLTDGIKALKGLPSVDSNTHNTLEALEALDERKHGELINDLRRMSEMNSMSFWKRDVCKRAADALSIPAVDAAEVVCAYWTRIVYKPIGHDYVCSACGEKNDRASRYCPDCGARMDGRREDGDE